MLNDSLPCKSPINLAFIPCELRGKYDQYEPINLIGLDLQNKIGYVKFDKSSAFTVALEDLCLAPSAYDTFTEEDSKSKENLQTSFFPKELVEVWIPVEKITLPPSEMHVASQGAWWPAQVLSVHEKLVHVNVAAAVENYAAQTSPTSTKLPFSQTRLPPVPMVVPLTDVRINWTGIRVTGKSNQLAADRQESDCLRRFLDTPDILHHHVIYLPQRLLKVALDPEIHANLLRFCNAPCIIHCERESVSPEELSKDDGYAHNGEESVIRLHIWSASQEAVRRTKLLEPIHMAIMQERFHVLNNLSSKKLKAPKEATELREVEKPLSVDAFMDGDDQSMESPSQLSIVQLSRSNLLKASFCIDPSLIGMVIGTKGSNIMEIRQMPGIEAVDVGEDGCIEVVAHSVDAIQQAREHLDFVQVEIPVEERLVRHIQGPSGANMRSLVEQSGVKRTFILGSLARQRRLEQQQQAQTAKDGPESQQNGYEQPEMTPAVCVVGTKSAVNKFRVLLGFQLDNATELVELEDTMRTLQTELHKFNGAKPVSRRLQDHSNHENTEKSNGERGRRGPEGGRRNPRHAHAPAQEATSNEQ